MTTIPVHIVILLLTVHYVADFLLQSDNMAINKSKKWEWLTAHVVVYTLCMMVFGVKFAVVNGIIHFCIDAMTSRVSAYHYQMDERHLFFCTIGLDQLFHAATLVLLYGVL